MSTLDLAADPVELTAALVDIESESRNESAIADAVESALREQTTGLEVLRGSNRVLARTNLGRAQRVILAGRLDTVPVAGNAPSRRENHPTEGDILHGCGTVDMKSGDAVFLHLAATIAEPAHDLTLIFYDCEEMRRVQRPQRRRAGVAGVARRRRRDPGRADRRAHRGRMPGDPAGAAVDLRHPARSARSWMGDNAIHKLGGVLTTLAAYEPRSVDIDGCEYREGLSAVAVAGGVAGNVIPDAAHVDVDFRFAPDRSVEQALDHVREVFAADLADGTVTLEVTDAAAGALPDSTVPRRPRSSRRRRGASARSTAGPTSRGSPRSASRRSISARATRTSPIAATSAFRWRRSARSPSCCAPTCPELGRAPGETVTRARR